MIDKQKFEINGYEMRYSNVAKSGTGAHTFVPKSWRGKDVAVILLEELDD